MDEIKNDIIDWAIKNPLILKVYIFGSRVRGDNRQDSDLDIALEISKLPGDNNIVATFTGEQSIWVMELQKKIPFKIDLECLNLDDDITDVKLAIKDEGQLIYEKLNL